MKSEANFRLSECQPRPGFASSPANRAALLHHPYASAELMQAEGSLGAGRIGASPDSGFSLRASSRAESASGVRGVRCS